MGNFSGRTVHDDDGVKYPGFWRGHKAEIIKGGAYTIVAVEIHGTRFAARRRWDSDRFRASDTTWVGVPPTREQLIKLRLYA
jgi:hypothetical protein